MCDLQLPRLDHLYYLARPLRVMKGVQYIFSSFITSVPDCISVQETQEDTWEWWNGLRTLCGNSKKLAVGMCDST